MTISYRRPILVALLMLAVGLAACGRMQQQVPVQKTTLYDRLGGKAAITAVVDQFVANVAADPRINHFFAQTDPGPFKAKLVDQICQGTGGPCTYTGKDMRSAHAGRNITDADFNALVEDLVAALNKLNVPQQEQKDLLAILGPMKPDIVGV